MKEARAYLLLNLLRLLTPADDKSTWHYSLADTCKGRTIKAHDMLYQLTVVIDGTCFDNSTSI